MKYKTLKNRLKQINKSLSPKEKALFFGIGLGVGSYPHVRSLIKNAKDKDILIGESSNKNRNKYFKNTMIFEKLKVPLTFKDIDLIMKRRIAAGIYVAPGVLIGTHAPYMYKYIKNKINDINA